MPFKETPPPLNTNRVELSSPLGINDNSVRRSSKPMQVKLLDGSYLTGVKDVAAGDYFALALTEDGTVYGWGRNDNHQLGQGSASAKEAAPVAIKGKFGENVSLDTAAEELSSTYGGFSLKRLLNRIKYRLDLKK